MTDVFVHRSLCQLFSWLDMVIIVTYLFKYPIFVSGFLAGLAAQQRQRGLEAHVLLDFVC